MNSCLPRWHEAYNFLIENKAGHNQSVETIIKTVNINNPVLTRKQVEEANFYRHGFANFFPLRVSSKAWLKN